MQRAMPKLGGVRLLTGVALGQISVWIPYGMKKATRKWPKSLILWRARLESNQ